MCEKSEKCNTCINYLILPVVYIRVQQLRDIVQLHIQVIVPIHRASERRLWR